MLNWKTTLFGLGAGGLNMFANGMGWKHVTLSIGLAFLGILSKDFNNSGTGNPGKL